MAMKKLFCPPWLNQALLDPASVFAGPEAEGDHPAAANRRCSTSWTTWTTRAAARSR